MSAGAAPPPQRVRIVVVVLLLLHGAWLGWSATWQSPTLNEPGQLASGIAHWTFLRFEPACVNPPLIRMMAAIPAIVSGCQNRMVRTESATGRTMRREAGK